GAAFSFLAGAGGWQRWFFAGIALVASVVILVWLVRGRDSRIVAAALALILGGALGNLWDRLALGHVVDFLDFHWAGYHFPAFNIADSAITVGAALIILDMLLGGRGHEWRAPPGWPADAHDHALRPAADGRDAPRRRLRRGRR